MRRSMIVFTLAFLFVSVLALGQEGQNGPGPGQQPGRMQRPGVSGTITAIDDHSITLKTSDGQTAQVNLSEKTEYRKERQSAKLADFKVGDTVFVRGEKSDSGVWQAQMVGARSGAGPGAGSGGGPMGGQFREGLGKQFIMGEVKSIDGTKLTILRTDGVTQTITVDENTSFRKDGQSITLADIKAGDQVFGRGELKSDVFVPSMLNVGMPPMMRGNGGQPGGTGAPPQQ